MNRFLFSLAASFSLLAVCQSASFGQSKSGSHVPKRTGGHAHTPAASHPKASPTHHTPVAGHAHTPTLAHPKASPTHHTPVAGHAHTPIATHPKASPAHQTPVAGHAHTPTAAHPKANPSHHTPVVGHAHAPIAAHPHGGHVLPGRPPVVVFGSPGFAVPAYPVRILGATVTWSGTWSGSNPVIVPPSAAAVPPGPDVAVVGDDESEAGPAGLQAFAERILEVANETNEAVTVYVQYRSAKNGNFSWAPADPRGSKLAVSFKLEPGQRTQINHGEVVVHGSKVRIWAEGASGRRWNQHQTQDLWLVPETNAQGQHVYQAVDMETKTYAIR